MIRDIFIRILSFLLRRLFSLRYRVRVEGLDEIKKILTSDKPVVVLPNHPAMTDPLLLYSILGQIASLKPVMDERFYYQKGVHWLYRLIHVVPIPDFEIVVNEWKARQGELVYQNIRRSLDRGEKVIIYPGGGLKRSPKEYLGGKSFVHRLLSEDPNLEVVLIRTTGLWGSSFSRAIIGDSPNFWKTLKRSFFYLLQNGIFFMPKREVKIEFSSLPADFPYQVSKIQFNRFLENWYNQYKYLDATDSQERPNLVPYLFWDKKGSTPKAFVFSPQTLNKDVEVPQEMREIIYEKLSKMTGRPKVQIKDEQDLAVDLGCDSLDLSNLITFLDLKFGIDKKISSLDLVHVFDLFLVSLQKKVPKAREMQSKDMLRGWKEKNVEGMKKVEILGKTLPQSFVERMKRVGGKEILADETATLTGKKALIATILLANKIRKLEGRYIGIMLPASLGSTLILFATMLAGKVPVMINWTSGSRSTDHVIHTLSIKSVLTARKFLDRVAHIELGAMEPYLVFAENLKAKISIFDKIKGFILSSKPTRSILSHFGIESLSNEMNAVVLSTSGTESHPKSVPLSHKNLIANMEDFEDIIYPYEPQSGLCALPQFHSFGLTAMTLFPILNGVRTYFSPDPTDSPRIVQEIQAWGIDLLALTPSFYANLLASSESGQLDSIRICFTGAEKAPQALITNLYKINPNAKLVEGYGITECSPVLSAQRFRDENRVGVGKALNKIELLVVDREDLRPLPQGEDGEILAQGPSVFKGYIEKDIKSPFVLINGKSYYRTGDFGHLDSEGNLILKGRLKRFTKVGGEMVNLPLIEEILTNTAKGLGWFSGMRKIDNPFVVIPIEREGEKTELVLMSVVETTLDEVNKILFQSGLPKYFRMHHVVKVSDMPLLGSGKVHLRALTDLAYKEIC
ncbi:MAG: AMP-binding protein [Chlamydiae bacterium]|nr:AMP-binding protein [Chlamydiota bacterium]